MAPKILTVLLSLSATVAAQSGNQITWASVIFTYHGEKHPYLGSSTYNLTPLGAQQLLSAGQNIRERYISDNGSQSVIATPINGMSVNDIDNSQIEILSTSDEFVTASALAFMQGLYPPRNMTIVDQESIMGDGNLEQFPLNGYQYPNVESLSVYDYHSISLAGNVGCTNYTNYGIDTLESLDFITQIQANEDFYNSLSTTVFSGLESDVVNYANAYYLYEYALYQYNHNASIYDDLSISDLSHLHNLASAQLWSFNTPNASGNIPAIAGQTLAGKVVQQFNQVIQSNGVSNKLTLLFGSFQPLLSFFALSHLSTGPSASLFRSLPEYGSVMSFDLVSYPSVSNAAQNLSDPFPATDQLFVRFYFRNGTSGNATARQYSLFGRGNSDDDISWDDFLEGMSAFSVDNVVDWCTSCRAETLFCQALEANAAANSNSTTHGQDGEKDKKELSPAIAGVIGATVTLGTFIIGTIVLCLFGFRIDYRTSESRSQTKVGGDVGVLRRSSSGNGGFKGAEKLASDTDLRLKSGAGVSVIRHERVGSWELSDSPKGDAAGKHSSLDKEIERGNGGGNERVVSKADYKRDSEDGFGNVNPFGDPVKALDQV